MDYETVFGLAEPYLKRNDFGMPHTEESLTLPNKTLLSPKELEELVFCSILMHDIGGSTIKKQY